MNALVFFVEQIALGLYILTGVAVFLALRSWMRARTAYRSTHFELERDIARYDAANALTVLVLLLEFGLIVLGVQRVVAPTVRATLDTQQSIITVVEDLPFYTPTPAPLAVGNPIDVSGVQLEEEDPAERVLATPTLTPTPVGTIIPNAPPVIGCTDPRAQLQVPANGQVVFEPTNVIGIANAENFAFYKFEIMGESTFNSFAPLEEHVVPVAEMGELGQFVPSFWQPGQYRFRLIVFDNTSREVAACEVTVYVSDPIPTPTPFAQDAPAGR